MSRTRHQIHFFAADGDLKTALAPVWDQEDLKLVKAGLTDENKPIEFATLEDVENLGTTEAADQSSDCTYLVLRRCEPSRSKPIPQKIGGTKYAYDQRANPTSVAVNMGGRNSGAVIAGQIGTVSEEGRSLELYRVLAARIRREFKKVGSYYLGPRAEEMWHAGARLTYSLKAPREYDLQHADM